MYLRASWSQQEMHLHVACALAPFGLRREYVDPVFCRETFSVDKNVLSVCYAIRLTMTIFGRLGVSSPSRPAHANWLHWEIENTVLCSHGK